jgi:hypothetical protein
VGLPLFQCVDWSLVQAIGIVKVAECNATPRKLGIYLHCGNVCLAVFLKKQNKCLSLFKCVYCIKSSRESAH